MKKVVFLSLLASVMIGCLMHNLWSATSRTSTTTGPYRNENVKCEKVTVDNEWPYDDMSNLSVTTGYIHGKLLRIAYDSTGTDTDWDLELKDELGIVLFTKDGLSSASEPGHYPLIYDDLDSNSWNGIPVTGYLTVDIDSVAQQAEVQTCTAEANADAGTFTITIDGQTTNAMAYDATTAAIDANISALSNIGDNVTSVVSTLDAGHDTPIVVTFDVSLGNVPAMTFDVADTNAVSVAVVETTEGGNLFSNLDIYIWYEE